MIYAGQFLEINTTTLIKKYYKKKLFTKKKFIHDIDIIFLIIIQNVGKKFSNIVFLYDCISNKGDKITKYGVGRM